MELIKFDGDYKVTTTKTPRFRIFDLGDGSDSSRPENAGTDRIILEYESLLLKMSEAKECQKITATASWGPDGRYRTQVHWYDVVEKREIRTDTDFTDKQEARGRDGEKGKDQPEGDESKGTLDVDDRDQAVLGETSVGSEGDDPKLEPDLEPAEK